MNIFGMHLIFANLLLINIIFKLVSEFMKIEFELYYVLFVCVYAHRTSHYRYVTMHVCVFVCCMCAWWVSSSSSIVLYPTFASRCNAFMVVKFKFQFSVKFANAHFAGPRIAAYARYLVLHVLNSYISNIKRILWMKKKSQIQTMQTKQQH